jgi:hypothetical protein
LLLLAGIFANVSVSLDTGGHGASSETVLQRWRRFVTDDDEGSW